MICALLHVVRVMSLLSSVFSKQAARELRVRLSLLKLTVPRRKGTHERGDTIPLSIFVWFSGLEGSRIDDNNAKMHRGNCPTACVMHRQFGMNKYYLYCHMDYKSC